MKDAMRQSFPTITAVPTNGLTEDTDKWAAIQAVADIAAVSYSLLVRDAIAALAQLPSESVDTCLTSPPYWSARDYEHENQIGLEDNVEDYIAKLVLIFREVRRVLTKDGTAWLNLGDCYLHNSYAAYQQNPLTQWKRNKQLALVPFRVAIALQEDGWLVRNNVVWHKPNAMPASVRDRLTNMWEPIFLLSKSEQYYFNLDSIRVTHKTDDNVERLRAERGEVNGKAKGKEHLRQWLNSPRHRSTIDGIREVRRRPNRPDSTKLAAYLRKAAEQKGVSIQWVSEQLGQPFERVRHYFRTDKIGSRIPPENTWEALKDLLGLGTEFDDAMAVEVGDNVFRNHPKGRNPGDLITVALSGSSTEHFAMMPSKLVDWTLSATLPRGGICLDPFMGYGTTGLGAIKLGGRFVGIDLHEQYAQWFVQAAKKTRSPEAVQIRLHL